MPSIGMIPQFLPLPPGMTGISQTFLEMRWRLGGVGELLAAVAGRRHDLRLGRQSGQCRRTDGRGILPGTLLDPFRTIPEDLGFRDLSRASGRNLSSRGNLIEVSSVCEVIDLIGGKSSEIGLVAGAGEAGRNGRQRNQDPST